MTIEEKGPVELIDDVFTIAYWMTGSLKDSNELAMNTFKELDAETPEIEVFKKFRDCYFEKMQLVRSAENPNSSTIFLNRILSVFRQQDADRKLSALLSEVCRLNHHSIAEILDKPVDTVRLLLSDGRTKLLDLFMFLCSLTTLELAYG
ncbi:MAG: RNA polymerase subunit sigma-24 [Chlorobiaceae bacterium]|nr:RNA polymerase subunit sigma-24 [Chlorobiaceae bacterium]